MNNLEKDNHQFIYVLGLLLITVFWGLGFPALKFCENVPTFFTMSFRFIVASALIMAIFWKQLKNIDKHVMRIGIWIGVLNFGCYITATIGIKYTTSARTAFFSCLGAICIPLLNWLCYKVKITVKFFICIAICVIGVYLISIGGSTEIGLNLGDIISLMASLFGAAQLVELEHKGGDIDVVPLTVVELLTIAVLSIFGMIFAGEPIPTSFSVMEIGSLLFMGICATAIAFLLQVICIKKVPSNRASLILTMEPVLGALSSVIILGDVLGWQGYLGGAIVVLSVVISEYSSSNE